MTINPDSATAPARTLGLTVFAVLLASALGPFAVTGPAVVLPALAADLHASSASTQWVQNAYNALFAATVLSAGSYADRIGRRRVLRSGIAVFGLAAALITISPSPWLVDALRACQGVGSGAIVSAGAAVLAHATAGQQRVRVFGLLGASFGAGAAVGPLAAGALDYVGGWRAVFILIAIGSAAALVASRFAVESRDPPALRADIPGMFSFGCALLTLSFGFVQAGEAGWSSPWTLGAFAGTIALLAAFVLIELRTANAMFDIRLFRRPAFTAVICQPFSVTFVLVVLIVYLPLFLQSTGASPMDAAVQLIPVTLPVLVVPLAAARLRTLWSVRTLLAAGSTAIAVGTIGLLVLEPGTSGWGIALPLVVVGIGVGLAFSVMDNAAVSTVPVEKAGSAAGMFNTMRIAGESLAVASAAAALTTLISSQTSSHDAAAAIQGFALTPDTGAVFAHALHVVFVALSLLALAGSLFTMWALRTPKAVRATDGV